MAVCWSATRSKNFFFNVSEFFIFVCDAESTPFNHEEYKMKVTTFAGGCYQAFNKNLPQAPSREMCHLVIFYSILHYIIYFQGYV